MKLVGFKHKLAQSEIEEKFFKDIYCKNYPKHWENTDQIEKGNNFISTHQVVKGS
jgi:hypothetical protein